MTRPSLEELLPVGRTAVVLQELQNGVVGAESAFPDLAEAAAEVGVIRNAARLAASARGLGVRVVHATAENLPDGFGANRNARLFAGALKAGAANAPGTSSVQPVSEVYAAGDLVLPRYHGLSPMADGQLDALLRNSGVTSILVAGVSLNIAIPGLVFDAINRSYRVVLLVDAVAGTPLAYGKQVLEHCLGLVATPTTTDAVLEAWAMR